MDKKYVINEQESKMVRLMFEMYSKGFGYNRIISKLNSLGYKTKRGKNSLYEIFRNEKYKGTYVFNKASRRKSDGSRSRKTKSDEEIIRIENGVPSIVEKEVWQAVNDKMDRNKQQSGSFKAKQVYLLTGLIRCGCCGYAMHGNARFPSKTRDKIITYRCSRKYNTQDCNNREIKRDEVELFVIDQLQKNLFNENVIPTLTKQLNQYLQQSSVKADEDRKQFEQNLNDLQNQKKNIVNAIASTGFSDIFTEKLQELEKSILQTENHLQQLKEELPNINITESKIREYLSTFKYFIKTKNIPQIKGFIDNYVEKVEVFPNNVKVTLKVAFEFVGDDRAFTFEVDSNRKTIKSA